MIQVTNLCTIFKNYSLAKKGETPCRRDSSILLSRVANHGARFPLPTSSRYNNFENSKSLFTMYSVASHSISKGSDKINDLITRRKYKNRKWLQGREIKPRKAVSNHEKTNVDAILRKKRIRSHCNISLSFHQQVILKIGQLRL